MQSHATVQMNVRIDGHLKSTGDQVLELFGLSPTQAVRGLWEYIVAHRDEPEAVRRVIAPATEDVEGDAALQRRLVEIEAGRCLCAALGPLPADIVQAPYVELRETMYARRCEGM